MAIRPTDLMPGMDVEGNHTVDCPDCGREQPPDNRFCEDCGASLGTQAVAVPSSPSEQNCPQCGSGPGSVDSNGFCTHCGYERIPPARDHLEITISAKSAGVSDRGKRHAQNEDFLILTGEQDHAVAILCDGVSSSQHPERASEEGATAACTALTGHLRTGAPMSETAMEAAIHAAHRAVRTLPFSRTENDDPPETTILAVVRQGRQLTLGWLGDSRAYLVGPAGARQITVDHSWTEEVVASGQMTLAEARKAPLAHALTRTLGGPLGPSATSDEPSLRSLEVPEGTEALLLCSDGFWNYLSGPEHLADLMHRQPAGSDALARARNLVEYANVRGGHDNITVALLLL